MTALTVAGPRRLVTLPDGRVWPGRIVAGLPAFDYRCAPSGLATRRELRAAGLAPGGAEPVARLVWRRGQRWAWLYAVDRAVPKRTATRRQLVAVAGALAARMVCGECGPVDHFVSRSTGLCGNCTVTGAEPTASTSAWRTVGEWVTGVPA